MTNLSIKHIKSEELEFGNCYSQFLINSLKSGQGITIGNQLRRVLLNDLGKKSITALRIKGMEHEFSTIPGVREDILEILLNLKGIVIKSDSKEPEIGYFKIQGPTVITADQIELSNKSKIVNGNHYIATISSNKVLEFEFKIEYGTGYKLASKIFSKDLENFLELDTIFMPVRQVEFKIENIYKNDNEISERLFLEIWTDGSMLPIDAIKKASQIIIDLFKKLIENKLDVEKSPETSDENLLNVQPCNNIIIEELQLSVRSYNCLKKAQINTVGDLLKYSPTQLMELKNFGKKSAEEVFATLKTKFGITLK